MEVQLTYYWLTFTPLCLLFRSCWMLNWYLSQCAHFSSSDPMWDRRDNAVTPRGWWHPKDEFILQENPSAQRCPRWGRLQGVSGACKGNEALVLSPKCSRKEMGVLGGLSLARAGSRGKKQGLLKVAANSQFGICLWFLTASFSKLGQIASNRAYFCFSTQVWCCSHCSHYILYIRFIIF